MENQELPALIPEQEKQIMKIGAPLVMPWLTSPEQRLRALTTATVAEAYRANSACIGLLATVNKDITRSILSILINDVVDFFNLTNSMDGYQLVQTVDLIIQDPTAKNLKPEDFKVIFDRSKKGFFGKIYNRIDGQIIFEWINAYAIERAAFVEDQNYNQHIEVKYEKFSSDEINPEGQAKVLEILKSATPEPEEVLPFTKDLIEPKKIEKDAKTILIQSFFNEFESLFKKKGIGIEKNGSRFVKVDSKILDQVEYVEYKLKSQK